MQNSKDTEATQFYFEEGACVNAPGIGRYVYETCLFSLLNPIRKKNVLDDSQNTHHMLQLLPFTYNHSICTHAVH